jgi:hypothetical protein
MVIIVKKSVLELIIELEIDCSKDNDNECEIKQQRNTVRKRKGWQGSTKRSDK